MATTRSAGRHGYRFGSGSEKTTDLRILVDLELEVDMQNLELDLRVQMPDLDPKRQQI